MTLGSLEEVWLHLFQCVLYKRPKTRRKVTVKKLAQTSILRLLKTHFGEHSRLFRRAVTAPLYDDSPDFGNVCEILNM